MENKEYKVIIETSENNIGIGLYYKIDNNTEQVITWRELNYEEKACIVNMIKQSYLFYNKILNTQIGKLYD